MKNLTNNILNYKMKLFINIFIMLMLLAYKSVTGKVLKKVLIYLNTIFIYVITKNLNQFGL